MEGENKLAYNQVVEQKNRVTDIDQTVRIMLMSAFEITSILPLPKIHGFIHIDTKIEECHRTPLLELDDKAPQTTYFATSRHKE
jgi:hypothetical protein